MRYDVEMVLEYGGEAVCFSGMLPGNYAEIDLERKHPAVILLAGGAYWRRTPREKEAVALKFLAQGISPWVLEYSVAPHVFPQSLCEVLTTVAWLREHGEEYHLDTGNISVCGFSAGGHLAASAGCFWDRDFVQELLGRPGDRVRPDKLILCYPVITSGKYAHQDSVRCLLGDEDVQNEEQRTLVSLEKQVGEDFPATFLWHMEKRVPLELHIYLKGKHGLSTGDFTSCGELIYGQKYSCADWVEKAIGFIYQIG